MVVLDQEGAFPFALAGLDARHHFGPLLEEVPQPPGSLP